MDRWVRYPPLGVEICVKAATRHLTVALHDTNREFDFTCNVGEESWCEMAPATRRVMVGTFPGVGVALKVSSDPGYGPRFFQESGHCLRRLGFSVYTK